MTSRITAWLNEPLVPDIVALYAPAGVPAPHVGNWLAKPPAGTKTVAVFVSVVNQHAKAVDTGHSDDCLPLRTDRDGLEGWILGDRKVS